MLQSEQSEWVSLETSCAFFLRVGERGVGFFMEGERGLELRALVLRDGDRAWLPWLPLLGDTLWLPRLREGDRAWLLREGERGLERRVEPWEEDMGTAEQ